MFLYTFKIEHPKMMSEFNPLNAKFTKWSNTLKQFVGKLPTNCLSVFDHFVGLTLKRLSVLSQRVHLFQKTPFADVPLSRCF